MVDNPQQLWLMKNLVLPVGELDEGARLIPNGPVYDLDIVHQLLRCEDEQPSLWVINEDADDDMENAFSSPMSIDEVKAIILSLRKDLHGSSLWGRTSARSNVACDAYTIKWSRLKQKEWDHGNKVYIKFGYRPNHYKCLVISIHPAKY